MSNVTGKSSGQGAYTKQVEKMSASLEVSYERGGSSPASVIATAISKALKVRYPKTRYVAGKYAKPMLFMCCYVSSDGWLKLLKVVSTLVYSLVVCFIC